MIEYITYAIMLMWNALGLVVALAVVIVIVKFIMIFTRGISLINNYFDERELETLVRKRITEKKAEKYGIKIEKTRKKNVWDEAKEALGEK